MVEVAGQIYARSVGARLTIETARGAHILYEVGGFAQSHALTMLFATLGVPAVRARTLGPGALGGGLSLRRTGDDVP